MLVFTKLFLIFIYFLYSFKIHARTCNTHILVIYNLFCLKLEIPHNHLCQLYSETKFYIFLIIYFYFIQDCIFNNKTIFFASIK